MRGEAPQIRWRAAIGVQLSAAVLLLACASDGPFQRDAAACRVEARASIVDVAAPPAASPRAALAGELTGAPDRGELAYDVCMRGRGWVDPTDPAAGRTVSAEEYRALATEALLACSDDAAPAPGPGEPRRASDVFCACQRETGAGAVELDLVVEADGSIARLAVTPDSALARCLRRELLHARLPAPPSAPWRTHVTASRGR